MFSLFALLIKERFSCPYTFVDFAVAIIIVFWTTQGQIHQYFLEALPNILLIFVR